MSAHPRPRLLHVINNLAAGGAENMLVRLAIALRGSFEQRVICVLDKGVLAPKLESAGIEVVALGASASMPNPLVIAALFRAIRRFRPGIVQTWLYHSDLLGGLAARAAGVKAIAWNVRGADLSWREAHPVTRAAIRMNAVLSARIPHRIVYCARSAEEAHLRLGYAAGKGLCLYNGVDVDVYRPDLAARADARRELEAGPETRLIGLFARWNAQKDHGSFFGAADLFMRRWPDVRFILAGSGIDDANPRLRSLVQATADPTRFVLLGVRHDIPRLTNALDLATSSSSWGEGFPNVIAEAMACGVLCVATDAGDAAEIVGDTGMVVPRRNPEALAAAWEELLKLPPDEQARRRLASRERIASHFSLSRAVEGYAAMYRSLLGT